MTPVKLKLWLKLGLSVVLAYFIAGFSHNVLTGYFSRLLPDSIDLLVLLFFFYLLRQMYPAFAKRQTVLLLVAFVAALLLPFEYAFLMLPTTFLVFHFLKLL